MVGHGIKERFRGLPLVPGVGNALGTGGDGRIDHDAVMVVGDIRATGGDDEHLGGTLEGTRQAGRVGEVAASNADSPGCKISGLVDIAHANGDTVGGHSIKEVGNNSGARLSRSTGHDDQFEPPSISGIGFGLANPALFRMLADPSRAASAGAEAGMKVLATRVHRVASVGRLRVAESRAVNLIHAAGMGAVLSILSTPAALNDLGVGDAMYDAVLAAILTDAPALPVAGTTASAVAFRTVVPNLPSLTDAERALMTQWLDRAIDPAS